MNHFALNDIVTLALMEDVGLGDLTSRYTIPENLVGSARVRARAPVVLSGLLAAEETMRQMDSRIVFTPLAADGDHLIPGSEIAHLQGSAASILSAERVALNFLMHLSGVATLTAKFVTAAANSGIAVVDTRKTTPGLRFLEKAAVRHGGGRNHRFALYDGILIKDNHIAAAGSIAKAVSRARFAAPHTLKIEVEVDTLDQLKEALTAGADLVLLDNMRPDLLRQAVWVTENFYAPMPRLTLLEASGGINLDSIGSIAKTGVDLISVGAITHSAPSVDLGLDWD
ncbi:MAG: nicotinate-nucleotide pyrophosphorylase [Candidatus Adiutrix intracellularis]|nr:MAG: nicotinate-nucleotide pyrophosphorylase [Candidatus Adiutrix intracellularis]